MGSRQHLRQIQHGPPQHYTEDHRAWSLEYAEKLDAQDPLRKFRDEFTFPTKASLKSEVLPEEGIEEEDNGEKCIYLCGNSLGLPPKRTSTYIATQLTTWARKGVYGHFNRLKNSPLSPWLDMDTAASEAMAPIVGAHPDEVAVMNTLTINLHLLLASFFRPQGARTKICIEQKAFPSDHYAVQSVLSTRGLPSSSLLLLPPSPSSSPLMTTEHIISFLNAHASEIALVSLPGIQFYTGEALDIKAITAHAHNLGIVVGWDLAHAAGNIPLALHDWDVDFAMWCSYKYLNSGPGGMGAMFVHERHGKVDKDLLAKQRQAELQNGVTNGASEGGQSEAVLKKEAFVPRLAGWWGGEKESRFEMENVFVPIAGARGWQVSNPSALDLCSVMASLSVFADAGGVSKLREKSVQLTGYLELLLKKYPLDKEKNGIKEPWRIITPREEAYRGAQLSLRLEEGLLAGVMEGLEKRGVVVDERRPDVVRVAPAPLYNSYKDCWNFVLAWRESVDEALRAKEGRNGTVAAKVADESGATIEEKKMNGHIGKEGRLLEGESDKIVSGVEY
ncbi:MAG: Kynureninase (L-kynurenine hydrolase) [Vezdaea acicularis]|nr:MAG: Kynureninase (L-kynurenine hydrolase) [Vezdaea acicularis]